MAPFNPRRRLKAALARFLLAFGRAGSPPPFSLARHPWLPAPRPSAAAGASLVLVGRRRAKPSAASKRGGAKPALNPPRCFPARFSPLLSARSARSPGVFCRTKNENLFFWFGRGASSSAVCEGNCSFALCETGVPGQGCRFAALYNRFFPFHPEPNPAV